MRNKAIACLGAIVACATALAGIPATAMADELNRLAVDAAERHGGGHGRGHEGS